MNRRLIHLDLFGYTPFAKLHIATREHFLRWFLTTDDNGVGYADPYRLKGELYLREHITIEEIARRHAELSPEIITTYAARDDDPFYAGILFSHIDLYNPDLPWRQNQPKSDRKKRIIGPTPDEAQPPKIDLFTVDSNWNPTGIQLESNWNPTGILKDKDKLKEKLKANAAARAREAENIITCWNKKIGLDPTSIETRTIIENLLNDGHTVHELIRAIERYAQHRERTQATYAYAIKNFFGRKAYFRPFLAAVPPPQKSRRAHRSSERPKPEPTIPATLSRDAEAWQRATTTLRREIDDDETWDTWFRHLRYIGYDTTTLYLSTVSDFSRNWITHNYTDMILNAAGLSEDNTLVILLHPTTDDPEHAPAEHCIEGKVTA